MTTIAWDGRDAAIESQLTGAWVERHAQKKFLENEGQVALFSGNWNLMLEWMRRVQKHLLPDEDGNPQLVDLVAVAEDTAPENPELEVECLVVDLRSGKAHAVMPLGVSYELVAPAGGGSGGKFAVAAMMAGASATEAVRIACELDPNSGGEIRTFLGETR